MFILQGYYLQLLLSGCAIIYPLYQIEVLRSMIQEFTSYVHQQIPSFIEENVYKTIYQHFDFGKRVFILLSGLFCILFMLEIIFAVIFYILLVLPYRVLSSIISSMKIGNKLDTDTVNKK